MNCEQIEVWISAHQDGELDPRRQRQVEDHLVTCAGCRELAAEWSALERTLRSELVRFDAPETLHTRVMRQIPEPAAAPVGRRGSWTPGGWAAAFGLVPVAAAAALMLMAANPSTPPQKVAPVPKSPSMTAGTIDPTPLVEVGSGAAVNMARTTPPPTGKTVGIKNTEGGPEKAAPRSKPPKAGTGGSAGGSRPRYDPIRGLRELRQRRKQYRVVSSGRRRSYRRQRDFQRDEPLRTVVKPETLPQQDPSPETPEQPMRMVQMPRVSVVDYVLPQVPSTAPASDGTDPQFVLRSAQAQEVAQGGYEF